MRQDEISELAIAIITAAARDLRNGLTLKEARDIQQKLKSARADPSG